VLLRLVVLLEHVLACAELVVPQVVAFLCEHVVPVLHGQGLRLNVEKFIRQKHLLIQAGD
jgi:hypothetical protein